MTALKKLFRTYAVALMHAINGLGLSLVSIFVPIYLLEIGFSVQDVIGYYIIYYVTIIIVTIPIMYLARKIGLLKTVILHTPFAMLFFALLWQLGTSIFSYEWIAITSGVSAALYWMALHLLFLHTTEEKSLGTGTGMLRALPKILTLLAPLSGGVIAVTFGFDVLFLISAVIIFLSIVPILHLKAIKPHFDFSLRRFWNMAKGFRRYVVAEVLSNTGEDVHALIWPVVVFLVLGSIEKVGLVGTLAGVGSIIMTLIVGRASDTLYRVSIMKIGAFLLVATWVLRYIVLTDTVVYVTTIVIGFFMIMFYVPFETLSYQYAKKNNSTEFIAFRELPVFLGRMLLLVPAYFVASRLEILFLFAAGVYVFFLLVPIKVKKLT